MATIRITNLKLRTVIGTNDWEREYKQDVVINIRIEFDASKASERDDLKDTLDYKAITKNIIQAVEP
ncbi:MAG: FolB domain-containing protein, partial [Candidatus Omnitrophica bacterium]|nr:FolB domain-containing protein [Candidatus Omnitrophota bacterium]